MTATAYEQEGSIKTGTIAASDLPRSIEAYAQHLGYHVIESGEISETLAASWAAPAMAGRAYALMKPDIGGDIFIRLVEATAIPDFRPLISFGWAGLTIAVEDVDRLQADLTDDSAFKVIGPPQHNGYGEGIHTMQAQGPSGEVLYFSQNTDDLERFEMPSAHGWVDHVFMGVLGARRLEEVRAYYTHIMGWTRAVPAEMQLDVVNRALSLPRDRAHKVAVICQDRLPIVQAEQYPGGAIPRPFTPGELPPGVAMMTVMKADLGHVTVSPVGPVAREGGELYRKRRSAAYVGAAGELIEIIETAD